MRSLIVLDNAVSDEEALLEGLPADSEILILNKDQDGVSQLADFLAGQSGIDALHIVSHGAPGTLEFGAGMLNIENLIAQADTWADIGRALTDEGDIFLYGCNVGQGEEGQAFIRQLAAVTGADVAASTDLTGAADKGGDWDLEANTGKIETSGMAASGYNGVLANGLVAYYSFNDPTNLGKDYSGNGNNGYIEGAVTSVASGYIGGAAGFGGYYAPGDIHIPNSSSLQFGDAFSISFAVKMTSFNGEDRWGNYSNDAWHSVIATSLDHAGMAILVCNGDASGNTYSGIAPHEWGSNYSTTGGIIPNSPVGEWINITYTFSNPDSTVSMYANGTLISQNTNFYQDFESGNDLYIGKYSYEYFPLNGAVDEVRIYNYALTAGEIPQAVPLGLNQQTQTIANPRNTVTIGTMFATLVYGDINLGANPSLTSPTIALGSMGDDRTDSGFDDNYKEYFQKNLVLGKHWTVLDGTNGLSLAGAAAGTIAKFTTNGLYHSYVKNLIQNQCHVVNGGITYGNSNAIVAVSGDTLVFAFRGTDREDKYFSSGQAWSGNGEYLHYEAFRPLIDAVKKYLTNNTAIKHVIVSGHSLGGAMADLFAAVDGRSFATPNDPTRDLAIVSLASPGIDPDAFTDNTQAFKNYDSSVVTVANDSIQLKTPKNFYFGISHDRDRVYDQTILENPETTALTPISTLKENINFPRNYKFNLPNISNYDVNYGGIFGQSGFGAHHNSLIYSKNMYEFNKSSISYTGQNLIFGIGTYAFGNLVGTSGSYVEGSGWWVPLDRSKTIHDSGVFALNGGNAADWIFGLEGDDALYGKGGNDYLSGGTGNDTLAGGTEIDTMEGGIGNDYYYVEVAGDIAKEAVNAGLDTVYSSAASFTLGENIENLVLTGTAAINGVGNALANTLTGNSAGNILNGGKGTDSMLGGDGNDIYVVSADNDTIKEESGKGIDLIQSAFSYSLVDTDGDGVLGNNVENLQLYGTANINGTGNALNNTLYASVGNNILNGGAGSDTVSFYHAGGAVNANLSLTTSQATGGSGSDQFIGIENLAGSKFNDTLTGNTGNNILNGGLGDDIMMGGLGNDTYVVSADTDKVIEKTGEGIDLIQSAFTYSLVDTDGSGILGGNVENLLLYGTAAINGTGNALNNYLTGNAMGNTLTGMAGNDFLNGGLGNDFLNGGSNSDTFVFNSALNSVTNDDTIVNFNTAEDTIMLDQSIFTKLGLGVLNLQYFTQSITNIGNDSNDYIIYNLTSGKLLYDIDGNTNGSVAAVEFATLGKNLNITAADFVVVA